jgi:transposase-like protein
VSRRIPPLSEAELVERYLTRGQSLAEIAADLGVHQGTVRRWLRDYGIPTRDGRGFSAETRAALLATLPAAYAGGTAIRAMAKEHNVSYGTVHRYLRAAGVTVRARTRRPLC